MSFFPDGSTMSWIRTTCTRCWSRSCCSARRPWPCPPTTSSTKFWLKMFCNRSFLKSIRNQNRISDWKIQVSLHFRFWSSVSKHLEGGIPLLRATFCDWCRGSQPSYWEPLILLFGILCKKKCGGTLKLWTFEIHHKKRASLYNFIPNLMFIVHKLNYKKCVLIDVFRKIFKICRKENLRLWHTGWETLLK